MLHASLKENRYDPDLLELPAESIRFIQTEMLNALNSSDHAVVKTALECFANLPYLSNEQINLAQAISQKLSHPDMQIRYNAALALKQLNNNACTKALTVQFDQEKNNLVGWTILDTLIHFKVWPTATQAKKYLQSTSPYQVAYSLIFQDHSKQSDLKAIAHKKCQILIHGNIQERLLLATTESYFLNNEAHQQELETLLHDPIDIVSIEAIKSIPPHANSVLINILLSFLGSKTKSWFAEKTLMKFPEKISRPLLEMPLDVPAREQHAMIRLLTLNHSLPILTKLIMLSKSSHLRLRLAIARALLRHAHFDINQRSISEKIIDMIEWSANEIVLLNQLDSEGNEGLAYEINTQLYINRCVFIAWFSLLTNKKQIASIAIYIERPSNYPENKSARAYELFDNLSINTRMRHAVKLISEVYIPTLAITNQNVKIHPDIIWLKYHHFQYQENIPMNIMDKTILLRRVKLFESVPVESLQAIAEIAQKRDIAQGETIFNENDETDRFYCIVSGTVCIKKNEWVLSELHEADYFGELGLLDNMPRSATAIASSNGALLYIEKEAFLNILEDLPEIMRAVVGQIIRYLRENLKNEHESKLN